MPRVPCPSPTLPPPHPTHPPRPPYPPPPRSPQVDEEYLEALLLLGCKISFISTNNAAAGSAAAREVAAVLEKLRIRAIVKVGTRTLGVLQHAPGLVLWLIATCPGAQWRQCWRSCAFQAASTCMAVCHVAHTAGLIRCHLALLHDAV
jgi:hypothetical protein